MDSDALWMALAMVLVIEGLLPFTSPVLWRKTFEQALRLRDGQIRGIGFASIILGLLLVWLI